MMRMLCLNLNVQAQVFGLNEVAPQPQQIDMQEMIVDPSLLNEPALELSDLVNEHEEE
jgi:hypothetical protein